MRLKTLLSLQCFTKNNLPVYLEMLFPIKITSKKHLKHPEALTSPGAPFILLFNPISFINDLIYYLSDWAICQKHNFTLRHPNFNFPHFATSDTPGASEHRPSAENGDQSMDAASDSSIYNITYKTKSHVLVHMIPTRIQKCFCRTSEECS